MDLMNATRHWRGHWIASLTARTAAGLALALPALAQCPPGSTTYLHFDGVSGRVATGNWPSPSAHTIEAWVRASDTQSAMIAGHAGNCSSQNCGRGMSLRCTSKILYNLDLASCGGSGGILTDPQALDGGWHHYAGTYDGSVMMMYRDGQLIGSKTQAWGPSDHFDGFSLGAQPEFCNTAWAAFFKGDIDEVRLWDHARTQAQIQQTANQPLSGAEPGLIGYWPIEEGSGSLTQDLSPGNHDGALQGGVSWAQHLPPQNYCLTSPNSSGPGATISSSGSTSPANASFALHVAGGVPNKVGVFFYGPSQVQTPFGEGFLCVGGGAVGIFRLAPAVKMGPTGQGSLTINFTSPPAGSGPGTIKAGSTWNFQFWYRDLAGGPNGYNLSDALRVTFCP